MSSPSDFEHLLGAINMKRSKPHLVAIFRKLVPSFQDPDQLTKPQLIASIQEYLKDNSDSPDAFVQSLIAYRPIATTVSQAESGSKKSGKSSADKAEEDQAEDSKPPEVPTG